jgi:hypothetical protein
MRLIRQLPQNGSEIVPASAERQPQCQQQNDPGEFRTLDLRIKSASGIREGAASIERKRAPSAGATRAKRIYSSAAKHGASAKIPTSALKPLALGGGSCGRRIQ